MQSSFEGRTGACTTLLGALLWAACGGGDGFQSGVPGNKALSELSASELTKICDATNGYRDGALPDSLQARATCVQSGLRTQSQAMCEAVSMACIDALEAHDKDAGGAEVDARPAAPSMRFQCYSEAEVASCSASVAELESCIGGTFAKAARALHALRCDLLDGGTKAPSPVSSELAVCEALDVKCPGLGNVAGRVRASTNPLPGQPDAGTDAGTDGGTDAGPVSNTITCPDLALQYDSSRCSLSGCTQIQCPCDPFTRSFGGCNSSRGCLTSIDCDAACAASSQALVVSCVQNATCVSDGDCGDLRCARSGASGVCTRGEGGDPCDDALDCSSGSCGTQASSMTCAGDAPVGASCTSDVQCGSGICYQSSGFSTPGQCSAGAMDDACSDDSDCVSKICIYRSGTGSYACSDGANGQPCQSSSDCSSSRCVNGGRSSSTCTAGQPGDPCDSSFDCSNSNCRTSPTTYQSTCAYTPGQSCPDGIADCNGDCRLAQPNCVDDSCTPACGASACDSVTLATWNPSDKQGNITLSAADLAATTTTTNDAVRATFGKTSGSWYWEITLQSLGSSGNSPEIGVTNAAAPLEDGLGNSSVDGVGTSASGAFHTSSNGASSRCGYGPDAVVGVALDVDLALVFFSIDGVWQGGADPATRTGGTPIGIQSEAVLPVISLSSSDSMQANFGQTMFAHTPPTGFSPLYQ